MNPKLEHALAAAKWATEVLAWATAPHGDVHTDGTAGGDDPGSSPPPPPPPPPPGGDG